MRVQPAVRQIAPGEQFSITVEIDAGGQGVSGATAYLDFDPAALTVLDVTPGSTLPIMLQNQFDNSTGRINIAQGAQLGVGNIATGTFALATIRFQAQTPVPAADTNLTFSTTPPRRSEVTAGDSSLLSDTEDGAIVFTGAQLTGFVTFERDAATQSPPHPSWQVPLTFALYQPGQVSPAHIFTPTTDAGGIFQLYAIEPGDYIATLKHSHTLQNAQPISLVDGRNEIDFGTLRAGDADNSNDVSVVDFSILADTFGLCQDAPDFDARADFNLSNCVTLFDFSLLSLNYTEVGETASAQQTGTSTIASDPIAEAGVDLRLLPSVIALTQGELLDLTIQVEAGAQEVDAVAVHLNFDPAVLKVLAVTPGETLPTQLRNVFDNQTGSVRYEAGKLGGDYPTGAFPLATIQFEVLTAVETEVSFGVESPRRSQVYRAGDEQLRAVYTTIFAPHESLDTRVYIPLIRRP